MLIHVPDDPEEAAAARDAIVADERLSYGALGLLLVILEHAPEWDVSVGILMQRARDRRGDEGERFGALRPILDELYDNGYLLRTDRRVGGKLVQNIEAFAVPEGPQGVSSHPDQVVYVIGQYGSGVVKIGTTSNLRARLRTIQTGSPVRLEVLWSCPGGRNLEAYLHDAFSPLRLEGEWFDFGQYNPISSAQRMVEHARLMGVR